jgi:vanillate/3-O-methylgallate O-demethylase
MTRSLQDVIDSVPDLVEYHYNETTGSHASTRPGLSPVPAEYTNWRDEQRAWRNTAILFDQSHHMPELFVKGPDARRLLLDLGVNSLANLSPAVAKQFVGCTPRGHIIGDCILYDLGGETFELVSGKTLLNWVQFHAEAGGYDVTVERDENTSDNATGRRKKFRFQLDGPNAGRIYRKVAEGTAPEIKFFRTAHLTIGGCEVMALRHGMAGHQGVELSGPFEAGERVRAAILSAGAEFGLAQGGSKAYFSSVLESGWIAYPLPAIYTGDDLRAFREWLPAESWEANFQLGGSFYSSDIEDYYVTPFDLGYDRIVKFDHDFVGRQALEKVALQPPNQKVTLVWHADGVTRIFRSLFEQELPYRYLEFPSAAYGFPHADEVRTPDGALVGLSTRCGYSANERAVLSLAIVDRRHAGPGTRSWSPGASRRRGRERERSNDTGRCRCGRRSLPRRTPARSSG